MASGFYKTKLLRKLANTGAMNCRQVLDERHSDLDEALKRVCVVIFALLQRFRRLFVFGRQRTRLGARLFRVYANVNIYSSKFVWRLRRLLDQALRNLRLDLHTVSNIKQIEGILVQSCDLTLMFIVSIFITKCAASCIKRCVGNVWRTRL
ncbi:elongation factor EF-Ts [Candidatus Hodgkinia cicadicola]|nr:elongation factor EF-Ts [Candidatus Hodgkinia cicadicola]